MKKLSGLLALSLVLILGSCNNDDDSNTITVIENTLFDLASVSDEDVSGLINFSKISDSETFIEVQLSESVAGNHPLAIYNDNAVDGTSVVLTLNPIDSSGFSSTLVTGLDNGTTMTYEDFLAYDGHVKVKVSEDDSTLIVRGDIGVNALTGVSRTYPLESNSDPSISGLIIFAQRQNDETLAVIQLNGTTSGSHPAGIYMNDVSASGPIAISLNDVDGGSGEGRTNISEEDNSTPITFSELTNYDGHVLVQLSATDTSIIAQGNIGNN